MLETAIREYNDELSRTRALDSKTTPMVAATGAVLVFAAGVALTPPSGLSNFAKGAYLIGVLFALLAFVMAEILFLSVLWGRPFSRIALGDVLSPGWGSSDGLRDKLAKVYHNTIMENTQINEDKANKYKRGIICMAIGLAILLTILAVFGIISAISREGS